MLLAYGRDPYFFGWPDTLQLNYANPDTQDAMIGELVRIAGQCDGVRCDMTMLVLPDVFERTWGKRAPLFCPRATRTVRERYPAFCFMAEVYWDLDRTLQPYFDLGSKKWRLHDQLSNEKLDWNGDDLSLRGLYVDSAPWQACVFTRMPCHA